MTTDVSSARMSIIGQALEAIEKGDLEQFRRLAREHAHPEVEWTPLIGAGVEGSYQGLERVISFFADYLGSFEVRYEDTEVSAVSDDVIVVLGVIRLKGRHSGVEVERALANVFEFEDGLVHRGRAFPTHPEATEAAKELVGERA